MTAENAGFIPPLFFSSIHSFPIYSPSMLLAKTSPPPPKKKKERITSMLFESTTWNYGPMCRSRDKFSHVAETMLATWSCRVIVILNCVPHNQVLPKQSKRDAWADSVVTQTQIHMHPPLYVKNEHKTRGSIESYWHFNFSMFMHA